MREFTVIIPARYGASRLPGKLLLDLAGKPVIARVIERAQTSGAVQVIVATDDARIERAAITAGAKAVLTRADHPSGTDRIAQAVQLLQLPATALVVNVQGDEPDMPAELIQQMANALAERKDVAMCTACAFIENAESISDPNIVKVVRDQKDMALYFSRAPIPFARDKQNTFSYRRHIGIYAYRAAYITKFSAASVCELEQLEKLEQLRALHRGEKIYCPDAIKAPGPGIDTLSDLEQARAAWNA